MIFPLTTGLPEASIRAASWSRLWTATRDLSATISISPPTAPALLATGARVCPHPNHLSRFPCRSRAAHQMAHSSSPVLLTLLAVGIALVGCGPSGPKIVKVSGVLTRNGKPVPNLEVYFMPTHGRNSVGMADENGRFNLGYTADQEGALV